jgi:hypothetical protein
MNNCHELINTDFGPCWLNFETFLFPPPPVPFHHSVSQYFDCISTYAVCQPSVRAKNVYENYMQCRKDRLTYKSTLYLKQAEN